MQGRCPYTVADLQENHPFSLWVSWASLFMNFLLKMKFNRTSGFNNKKIENHVSILEPDNG